VNYSAHHHNPTQTTGSRNGHNSRVTWNGGLRPELFTPLARRTPGDPADANLVAALHGTLVEMRGHAPTQDRVPTSCEEHVGRAW
jgi:hypothetical protein